MWNIESQFNKFVKMLIKCLHVDYTAVYDPLWSRSDNFRRNNVSPLLLLITRGCETNIAADRSGRQEDPTLPRLFSGIRKIARGPRATRERTVIRPKSDRKRAHVAKDLTSGGLVRR